MNTADAIKSLTTEEHFRTKSKAMALVLLQDCYDQVTDQDSPAPFNAKHDFLKTVTKFAGLEPKDDVIAQGARFSIKIVYNGDPARDEKIVSGVTFEGVVGFSDNPPTYLQPTTTADMLASLTPPEEEFV